MPRFQPSLLAVALVIPVTPLATSSAAAQASSPLRLDRTDYHATCIDGNGDTCSYGFRLIATYENQTADTIFLSRCMPRDRTPRYGLEPFPDTTQEAAYDPTWACVGHDFPVVVPPHTMRVDTLQIEGPNAFDGKTFAPLGKLEGQFRLLYDVRLCRRGAPHCSVWPQLQPSQVFRVHLVR